MPRIKSDKVVIFAAVSSDGSIVLSSISAFRSVANRWASKYRNAKVVRLAELSRDYEGTAEVHVEETPATEVTASENHDEIKVPNNGNNGNNVRVPRKRRNNRNEQVRKAVQ